MTSRLSRVIKLLQRREDAAAAERARTARAVADAQGGVDAAECTQAQLSPPVGRMGTADLQYLRLRALGAAAGVERAVDTLTDRRAEDDEAEEARTFAAVRRRSVERLAERRETVAVQIAAVASQRALDDLATLRRARQQQEGRT